MNATNRAGNRLVLALVGLVLIAAGAWLLLRAYPDVVPAFALPDLTEKPDATTLWITAVVAAIVIVLALVAIFRRGGGHTSQIASVESADGSVELRVKVADALLSEALDDQPDVVSVRVSAYRVRRAPALSVAVTARHGADLPRLIAAAGAAVEKLDSVLETRIPVLLNVTSGVRASLARDQRVV